MSEYEIEDCAYIGKRALVPNRELYNILYSEISIISLFLHADSFGYSLYEMYENSGSFAGLFVLRSDFKNVWPAIKTSSYQVCCVSAQVGEFVHIDKKLLDKVKKSDGRVLSTYILQRCLWPEDISLIASHKRIEYETCRHIIEGLGDSVQFQQQYQIMDYRADILFEIKHSSLSNIPSIILEIDEDGHAAYDNEKEKQRQAVCEYFTNRVVHISVSSRSTPREIKLEANKAVNKLKTIISELVAQYTEEISPEFFIERLNRYDIEKQYISFFYKKSDNGSSFRYDHESIGEFLGYVAGADKKYKRLRGLIDKHLDKGEDYTECEILSRDTSVPAQDTKKNMVVLAHR